MERTLRGPGGFFVSEQGSFVCDMNEGWIKMHRKIRDHWIWQNRQYLRAWFDILFTVNFEDKKVLIESEIIECKRGQSLLSLNEWSKVFGHGWTVQRVRTFFDLLKKDQMIKTEGLRKTTRLTVCNYDNYQNNQQTDNTQTTDRQQTSNTQVTTTKEIKESKERIKNENNIIPPPLELVVEYCEKRSNNIDPQYFIDWNEARGWMLNGRKMKDWQAAIRTWESKQKQKTNGGQKLKFTEADFK